MATAEEPLLTGICRVEYAKSGRSTCKLCKTKIAKDDCRFGNITRSRFHDGFETSWMHMTCGLAKKGRNVTRISQLKNWVSLKYEDQRKIKEHTGELKSSKEEAKDEAELRKVGDFLTDLSGHLSLDECAQMLAANRIEVSVDFKQKAREALSRELCAD
eukprot:5715_1